MRILHVTDSYLPTVGGIELHIHDLAARQRGAGHQVTVVTRTPGPAETGPDDVRRLTRMGAAWPHGADPDVVHAHASIISPFALATAQRAAQRGIPTVVTVHSLWTHVGPLPELVRDLWGMRGWGVTWTAVSEPAARPVRELLGVPVHLVPNAVDLAFWSPLETAPLAGRPHVVSVMRLTGVKRALPLARILRRAAGEVDFTATVVGNGPSRAAVQRYLRRHGLTGRVRLTGALDRARIRRLLAEASVFVAPAHRESFGIAALEARARGLPVVASARSGVSTFVEDGREGLLGRDDRELTSSLVRLLRDDALRDRMAWHNRLVPPAHGWQQALARNDEVYGLAVAAAASRALAGSVLRGVVVG